MRTILAFALPPLAVLLCGRPLHFILNVFLTACFWIPGVVHALVIVQGTLYDAQTDRTMRRMESAIAESNPEARAALQRHRRKVEAKRFVAGGLLLMVGYILSIGPISWLKDAGRVPGPLQDLLWLFYLPLEWLGGNIDWFADILEWYRSLWEG